MSENILLQFPSQITGVQTKLDCYKVTLDTSGFPPAEQITQLLKYCTDGIAGWFTFNVHLIQPEDIIKLPPLPRMEKNQKTPSERLRAVLFVMWNEDHGGYETSDAHYAAHMEKFIDFVKGKLPKE
jgi:hypothetical protein